MHCISLTQFYFTGVSQDSFFTFHVRILKPLPGMNICTLTATERGLPHSQRPPGAVWRECSTWSKPLQTELLYVSQSSVLIVFTAVLWFRQSCKLFHVLFPISFQFIDCFSFAAFQGDNFSIFTFLRAAQLPFSSRSSLSHENSSQKAPKLTTNSEE